MGTTLTNLNTLMLAAHFLFDNLQPQVKSFLIRGLKNQTKYWMAQKLSENTMTMGSSILYPHRGMDVTFEAFPERVEFHGVSPCIRVF